MPGKPAEAWGDGLQAARADEPAKANPHARGTELSGRWDEGWRQGQADKLDPAPKQEPKGNTPGDR